MIIKLNREEYVNNETYFFHIFNDLGFIDLELAYNYKKKDGSTGFSKWIRFDYLQSIDLTEKVEGTFDTKEQFLNKVTHRRILDIEVVLDIDETPEGSINPDEIKKYAIIILKQIKRKGFSFEAYFSGSKSVHANFLFPRLRDMSVLERDRFKKSFIMKFKGDIAKAGRRNMIALEGVPHWKTGIVKEVFKYE